MDNWVNDLWGSENPDFSEFIYSDRSSGTRSRTGKVSTDIKIVKNTKINHKMVSLTDYYNAISLDRLPLKTEIGKY